MKIQGKSVLITGASSGIGAALARAVAGGAQCPEHRVVATRCGNSPE